MKGYAYDFLAILHAVTVILTLLWLPFGKLFHILQRPAQLGVALYKESGQQGPQAICGRWIPMLVILGVWRHLIRRFPLRYDPLYWGAVFPLGMYTVCTYRLAQIVDVPGLMAVPRAFAWVALLAWTATMLGPGSGFDLPTRLRRQGGNL